MSVLRPCTWCAKEFTPSRSDGLFCSNSCKQAYWRWKHRLNLIISQASNAIDEIEQYLEYPNKRIEAENALGMLADKLAAMGFEASDKELELPAEAYTLSNSTGDASHE